MAACSCLALENRLPAHVRMPSRISSPYARARRRWVRYPGWISAEVTDLEWFEVPIQPGSALTPLPLGVVPCGERLEIRHPGEAGLPVGGDGVRGDHDVEERRPVSEGPIDGAGEILGLLDALGVHPEGPGHRRMVGVLEPGAHDLPVSRRLVVDLDLPPAVVGHDEEGRGKVPHRRVQLDGVEPERAVARCYHHKPLRIGEAGGDPERHSYPDAAEGSGVEIGAGGEGDPREGEEVTAVG